MCDDLVGKEITWPPVLVVQLRVYRGKVPATSFCSVKFLYTISLWMFPIFELESAESKQHDDIFRWEGKHISPELILQLIDCMETEGEHHLSLLALFVWEQLLDFIYELGFSWGGSMRWHIFGEGECTASDLIVQFRGCNGKVQVSKSWLYVSPMPFQNTTRWWYASA